MSQLESQQPKVYWESRTIGRATNILAYARNPDQTGAGPHVTGTPRRGSDALLYQYRGHNNWNGIMSVATKQLLSFHVPLNKIHK